MLEYVLRKLLARLLSPIVLAWFGGIWGYRDYLRSGKSRSAVLTAIYNDFFSRRGAFVGLGAHFDGPPCLPHGWHGIFISKGARIGRNAVIFQQVTIGSNSLLDSGRCGSPVIGDNVYLGAGAKVIGGIRIADNCRIGANAVVYSDMPPNSLAVQAPTRIILRDELDNRFVKDIAGKKCFFADGRWIELTEPVNPEVIEA